MRVGVVFKMAEAVVKLRNRIFQKKQHIAFHVRVGVLVDGQTARRMLRKKNVNAIAVFWQNMFNFPPKLLNGLILICELFH